MAMGGIGETMLLNAAIGGTVSAVAGGDPLKGALLGGLSGGMMSGFGGAAAAPTGVSAAPTMATTAPAGAGEGLAALMDKTTGVTAESLGSLAGSPQEIFRMQELTGTLSPVTAPAAPYYGPSAGAEAQTVSGSPALRPEGLDALRKAELGTQISVPSAQEAFRASEIAARNAASPSAPADRGILGGMIDKFKNLPFEKQLLYGGLGGMGLMSLMNRPSVPGAKEDDSELKKFRYRIGNYSPSPFAGGGIVALMRGGPSDLGSYSDGGRMLKGPGDGMSDNIPGVIGGKRPARLADGEFVVPADVVSHLGNGSTNAGAKQLYAMMARVRAARTGTKKQGKQINPSRMMPA